MKYIIDDKTFDNANDAANYIAENISEDVYDEMLDECYGEIEICGYSYDASIALYRVDPIAYRCGFSDYTDSLISDIEYELERMDDGDTDTFYDCTVECIDDEIDESEDDDE